jgi:motility quorum-sensing regulator/GCU-specific mRNA interferase toxin
VHGKTYATLLLQEHADHRVWQDVYHAKASDQDIYLKLTVVDGVLIVSFKEL